MSSNSGHTSRCPTCGAPATVTITLHPKYIGPLTYPCVEVPTVHYTYNRQQAIAAKVRNHDCTSPYPAFK